CQAIHYSTFLFADSVMWLKLGHMNQHILPLMSAISRLSIMCRAIVVYCCDLYKGVHQLLTRLKASHVKVCLCYVESLLPLTVSCRYRKPPHQLTTFWNPLVTYLPQPWRWRWSPRFQWFVRHLQNLQT